MNTAINRLHTLSVNDVMARDVVQVTAHESMAAAAQVFAEHEVAAAPVIDELGNCVGILSATDFLRRECRVRTTNEQPADGHELVADDSGWRISEIDNDLVSANMTETLQTVAAGASLLTAARMMCTAHLHRLVVLDERGHPVGIVSTMDVVAALLNAVDEETARL